MDQVVIAIVCWLDYCPVNITQLSLREREATMQYHSVI